MSLFLALLAQVEHLPVNQKIPEDVPSFLIWACVTLVASEIGAVVALWFGHNSARKEEREDRKESLKTFTEALAAQRNEFSQTNLAQRNEFSLRCDKQMAEESRRLDKAYDTFHAGIQEVLESVKENGCRYERKA